MIKEARADKAVGVSVRLRLGGRYVELTPGRPGVRAGKAVPPTERERLLAPLREDLATWRESCGRVAPMSPVFPAGSGAF